MVARSNDYTPTFAGAYGTTLLMSLSLIMLGNSGRAVVVEVEFNALETSRITASRMVYGCRQQRSPSLR